VLKIGRLLLHSLFAGTLGGALAVYAATADAAEVAVGFGDHIPPFCFPQTSSGIEVEIFREALAYRGHTIKPQFYPMKRIAAAFAKRDVDAAMMDSGIDLTPFGGIYAQPAVVYDNIFISLSSRHLKIKSPSDLKGLTVIAFPGALERYPEWLQPVKAAGNYVELNDQYSQVKALEAGHYDLAVSDRYIFRYHLSLLHKEQGSVAPVD